MTPNDSCFLSFYRDGEEWFTVEVRILFPDTTALSELPVFSIEESESAHTYCRFLNGTSPDELLSLSYDEAKHTGFYLGGEENSVEDVLYAHNLFDRISDTTFE